MSDWEKARDCVLGLGSIIAIIGAGLIFIN